MRFAISIALVFCLALFGCDPKKPTTSNNSDKGHSHGHHHSPKYGGALVPLGDHFAHLEVLLNEETGTLTAYVMDGEVEKNVRIAQDKMFTHIDFEKNGSSHHIHVDLKPFENEATGEKPGDSSEFRGQSDKLKGVKKFTCTIEKVEIKGQTLKKISFAYPEGGEGEHGHDHSGHDHSGHDHSDHKHEDGEEHKGEEKEAGNG